MSEGEALSRRSIAIRPATRQDASILAALEAAAFGARSWGGESVAEGLSTKGVEALLAEENGTTASFPDRRADILPIGFALWRLLGAVGRPSDGMDAEILTIGVTPTSQRAGVGRLLLDHIIENASQMGAESLFLEVAEDNAPAIRLYEGTRFDRVGRRDHYYPDGCAAIVMKRLLQ